MPTLNHSLCRNVVSRHLALQERRFTRRGLASMHRRNVMAEISSSQTGKHHRGFAAGADSALMVLLFIL